MQPSVLTRAALNRATLARQMLLERQKMTPVKAIERLIGLQAQLARPPYLGLWSRLAGFSREQLTRAIDTRQIVRATLMRCTLHLWSARDYRRLRPSLQPALDRGLAGAVGKRLEGVDLGALAREATDLLAAAPLTFDELRKRLGTRRPDDDLRALGYGLRCTLPLVQVPATGSDWAYPGAAAFTPAACWLGARIDGAPDVAPFRALSQRVRAELAVQGVGLLRFVERDLDKRDVRFTRR